MSDNSRVENNIIPDNNDGGKGGLLASDGVNGRGVVAADCKMISKAIRCKWGITPEIQAAVVNRLNHIVQKTEVEVMTVQGPMVLAGPADANSIKAASVLVAINAQDQADDHHEEKNKRLDEGKPTEIVRELKIEFDG